jgi:hypothetical protein
MKSEKSLSPKQTVALVGAATATILIIAGKGHEGHRQSARQH